MIDKMQSNWKALCLIGAILAFGYAGGTEAWALKQEVAENTTARLIQTFEQLSIIKRHRRLSVVEWSKWCSAGRRLGVFVHCPPR